MDEKKIVYTATFAITNKNLERLITSYHIKIYRTSTEKYFDYNTNYYIAK